MSGIKKWMTLLFLLLHSAVMFCQTSDTYGCDIDTLAVSYNLNKATFFSKQLQNKDSAVYYMNRAFKLIPDKKQLPYNTLLNVADYLQSENNFTAALEYYLLALKVVDNSLRSKPRNADEEYNKYINLCLDIARCQYLYNPGKAIEYLKTGLEYVRKLENLKPGYDVDVDKSKLLNNIGAVYTDLKQTDSAEYYYRQAFALLDKSDYNALCRMYNNFGIIAAKKHDVDKAKEYFSKALDCKPDTLTLANIYLNMGNCAYVEKNFSEAVSYFSKAQSFAARCRDLRLEIFSHESLSDVYENLEQFGSSLMHLRKAHELKDSLLNIEQTRANIESELSYQYQKQKDEMLFREKVERDKRDFRTAILVLVIIILFVSAILLLVLYNYQKKKVAVIRLEQESVALQSKNLALQNKMLNDELESKRKELSAHAQYMVNRKDFVTKVIEQVVAAKDVDDAELDKTIKKIKNDLQSQVGSELHALFSDLHQDFFKHLYERHPNLTPNEKRLCAFIHVNMSSKEISSITGQSVKSIEIARSRLRAKLKLEQGDNLCAYLQQVYPQSIT